jgi:hypothetical protein
MGQARQRKAEIDELKTKGPKVKPTVEGYQPDAGMNSPAFIEQHYWVSSGQFIQELHYTMTRGISPRAYNMNGTKYMELNFSADIMDLDGSEHLAPETDKGYFTTVRFTPEQIRALANEIRKGGMSFRISGVPDGAIQKTMAGESFIVIDYKSSWSAGNNSGYMAFSWFTGKGMASSDSNKLAETLDGFAEQLANFD